MVKVRDLSEKQLDEQIEKYQNILDRLKAEKDRRGGDSEPIEDEKTKEYHLKLDEDELIQLEKQREERSEPVEEEPQDEVGVTQILKLNKDLLNKD